MAKIVSMLSDPSLVVLFGVVGCASSLFAGLCFLFFILFFGPLSMPAVALFCLFASQVGVAAFGAFGVGVSVLFVCAYCLSPAL